MVHWTTSLCTWSYSVYTWLLLPFRTSSPCSHFPFKTQPRDSWVLWAESRAFPVSFLLETLPRGSCQTVLQLCLFWLVCMFLDVRGWTWSFYSQHVLLHTKGTVQLKLEHFAELIKKVGGLRAQRKVENDFWEEWAPGKAYGKAAMQTGPEGWDSEGQIQRKHEKQSSMGAILTTAR